jgi:tRNA pseudouridine38-40 synthase
MTHRKKTHLGFRVAYFGKNFQGFQMQAHEHSIQFRVEQALSIFFRRPVKIEFTSRTDSGVHAYDQLIMVRNSYELFANLSLVDKKRFFISINSLLKDEIVIWKILKLAPTFHPKKHILWKEYEYFLYQGVVTDPLMTDVHWSVRSPLDMKRMLRELKKLKGKHDFSSFASATKNRHEGVDNVRTILEASLKMNRHPRISALREYRFLFRGDGFLYRMVRNIVGALVEIGRGKDIDVAAVLKSKKRLSIVKAAPPQGLVLRRTKIQARFVLKVLALMLASTICAGPAIAAFNGSASFTVNQRFFDDERLGEVNEFSQWGAIEFKAKFGLVELPFHLEPIIGFSFIKNSAPLYKLDDNGNYILDSDGRKIKSPLESLEYQFYTVVAGIRWKAWDPDFFWLIPYAEVGHDFRYGRVRKHTYAVDQQKLNTGFDLGLEFGGGLLISFFLDKKTQQAIEWDWRAKDYALMTSIHYSPDGYYRNGLGRVDSTGGWDFGAGLFLDW